jgi:hypothetical protein
MSPGWRSFIRWSTACYPSVTGVGNRWKHLLLSAGNRRVAPKSVQQAGGTRRAPTVPPVVRCRVTARPRPVTPVNCRKLTSTSPILRGAAPGSRLASGSVQKLSDGPPSVIHLLPVPNNRRSTSCYPAVIGAGNSRWRLLFGASRHAVSRRTKNIMHQWASRRVRGAHFAAKTANLQQTERHVGMLVAGATNADLQVRASLTIRVCSLYVLLMPELQDLKGGRQKITS